MKIYYILPFALLLFTLNALSSPTQAQVQPETVYKITELKKPNDWYKEQVEAWTAVTQKDPKNAAAWLNLYKAKRYYNFPAFRRDSLYNLEMNALVDAMEAAIPNSFEFNWVKSWNGGNDGKYWPYMEKAYEIDPNRPEIYEDMLTHYEIEGDWEKVDLFAKKWYESKIMAPSLLWTGYNMLQSTDPNGILFTYGDNDTYPLYVLQSGKGIRTDVATVNISLMMIPDYTRKLFERKGIQYDESALTTLTETKEWPDNVIAFVDHIAEKNPNRKIYLVSTMHQKINEALKDDLWCVGLTYQYSKEKVDKPALIRRNLDRMKLDYLEMNLYSEDYLYEASQAARHNMIYFEPFAQLYEHYLNAGDSWSAAKYREKSLNLAKAAGMDEQVTELLDSLESRIMGK